MVLSLGGLLPSHTRSLRLGDVQVIDCLIFITESAEGLLGRRYAQAGGQELSPRCTACSRIYSSFLS